MVVASLESRSRSPSTHSDSEIVFLSFHLRIEFWQRNSLFSLISRGYPDDVSGSLLPFWWLISCILSYPREVTAIKETFISPSLSFRLSQLIYRNLQWENRMERTTPDSDQSPPPSDGLSWCKNIVKDHFSCLRTKRQAVSWQSWIHWEFFFWESKKDKRERERDRQTDIPAFKEKSGIKDLMSCPNVWLLLPLCVHRYRSHWVCVMSVSLEDSRVRWFLLDMKEEYKLWWSVITEWEAGRNNTSETHNENVTWNEGLLSKQGSKRTKRLNQRNQERKKET
jgi:hypothetical protein